MELLGCCLGWHRTDDAAGAAAGPTAAQAARRPEGIHRAEDGQHDLPAPASSPLPIPGRDAKCGSAPFAMRRAEAGDRWELEQVAGWKSADRRRQSGFHLVKQSEGGVSGDQPLASVGFYTCSALVAKHVPSGHFLLAHLDDGYRSEWSNPSFGSLVSWHRPQSLLKADRFNIEGFMQLEGPKEIRLIQSSRSLPRERATREVAAMGSDVSVLQPLRLWPGKAVESWSLLVKPLTGELVARNEQTDESVVYSGLFSVHGAAPVDRPDAQPDSPPSGHSADSITVIPAHLEDMAQLRNLCSAASDAPTFATMLPQMRKLLEKIDGLPPALVQGVTAHDGPSDQVLGALISHLDERLRAVQD